MLVVDTQTLNLLPAVKFPIRQQDLKYRLEKDRVKAEGDMY